MKIKVVVTTDPSLVKQAVIIEDEDNHQNYLIVTTGSPKGSIRAIIEQLQKYLEEHK